jgi:hypothetical protein
MLLPGDQQAVADRLRAESPGDGKSVTVNLRAWSSIRNDGWICPPT